MKFNVKQLLSALIVTASISTIAVSTSFADEQKCGPAHDRQSKFDGKHGADTGHPNGFSGHEMHGLRRLDLTEAQQDQVKKIFDQQKPLREVKALALRDSFKAIREASVADKYDSKKVQELAAKQSRLQTDLIVLHAETKHQIYALLTAEQKQKLEERHSKEGSPRGEQRPS